MYCLLISLASSLESATDIPIISVLVPFSLESAPPVDVPSYLSGSGKFPISLITVYTKLSSQNAPALSWALENSRAVDVDVRSDLTESDSVFEGFEELLTTATNVPEGSDKKLAPIILCK